VTGLASQQVAVLARQLHFGWIFAPSLAGGLLLAPVRKILLVMNKMRMSPFKTTDLT
jgi:hypothetical protein